MKQHIYLLLMFLAAALAGGCDNTLGNDEEEGDGTVSVTLTTAGAISKAGMDGSMNITWDRNDEVLVNGERYRVSPDGENPSTVTISGVYESDGYLAVFPYSNQYTAEDSYLVYIPDRQAYSTDMPLETYPMIAYSTSTDLQMNGVCGVVRIGLTGSGNLVRATVSGHAPGDILAGTLAVPAADVTGGSMKDSYSEFYTEYRTSGSVEITVDRGLEINETAKYIYAAVPAREYASGFTIEFEDSDRNRTTVTVDGSVRVPRAKVTDLGTFTLEQGSDEPPVQENPVSLEISQEYAGPRPYAEISYRISTQNAVRIDCAVVGMATYENESSAGASDEEIVMKYSDYPLGESHVEEANNGGYLWTDMFLEPDTDYVFLAAATGEDNNAAVRSEVFSTEDYLPEASAESSWNTVSTDGFMECNLFSEILGQGGYPARLPDRTFRGRAAGTSHPRSAEAEGLHCPARLQRLGTRGPQRGHASGHRQCQQLDSGPHRGLQQGAAAGHHQRVARHRGRHHGLNNGQHKHGSPGARQEKSGAGASSIPAERRPLPGWKRPAEWLKADRRLAESRIVLAAEYSSTCRKVR